MKQKRLGEAAYLLVADDDPLLQEVLKTKLQRSGYRVEVAGDGGEALEMIEREAPDLLILDLNMPVLDGYEVCRSLRAHEETKALPIIILTAYGGLGHIIKGMEAGADDYVTKPFEIEEVLVRIRSLLRTKRIERDLRQREKQLAKIEATSQLMVTIAHHINNSLTIIGGRAQAAKADDPVRAQKLIDVCLTETQRISAVIKSLEEVANQVKYNTTAYAGVEDAMVDIREDIERILEVTKEEESA